MIFRALIFVVAFCGLSCDSSQLRDTGKPWREFHWSKLREVKVRLTPQGRSQANIKNKNTEEYFIIPIEGWRVIESLIIPGKKMATPNRPRVDKVNEYCEIVLITKESHLMSLVLADAGDVLPAYIIDGIVYQHDEEGRFRNALPIRNARPAIGQYMLIPELTRYLARYEGGLTEQERGENEQMLGHYLEWTASE